MGPERYCGFCGISIAGTHPLRRYCSRLCKGRSARSKDVPRKRDKEKDREYQRRWDAKHPEYQKQYYQNNKERIKQRVRRNRLLNKYGLTEEALAEMLEAQGGVCAICNQPCDVQGRLSIDHCHKSGEVRALLCQRCNTGIGFFRENPSILAKAIVYLGEHR